MADKTIGDLNFAPGTVDDSNTLFVVQQSGAAYKLSGHEFITALGTILDGHGGIKTISYTAPVSPSLVGTLTITLADDSVSTLSINNGKGITSITKTGSVGTPVVDTYTIAYNDGTSTTFTVTNGAKGDTGDSWYVWIKYAGDEPTQDSDMGDTPDNWMGIYSGTASSAPVHYTSYDWFEIKGDKGDQGDSISAVSRTSGTGAPGTTDTYTVYVDGSPVGTFSVYNGSDGQGSPGTQTPLVDSGSGVVGVAVAYAHEDHQHPLNVATTGTPAMDGTAALGSAGTYARTDHVHPTDTSRASQTDMTAVQSGKADKSDFTSFTVTLASASWSSNAQTVSNANFIASGYAYIVSPASGSFTDYGTAQIYADDVTTDGSMTFHCTDEPSSNLTVNVVRVVAS